MNSRFIKMCYDEEYDLSKDSIVKPNITVDLCIVSNRMSKIKTLRNINIFK